MKSFSLFVSSSPTLSHQCADALLFAKQVIQSGHQLRQVFFYSEAVTIAMTQHQANNSTFNLHKEWKEFAEEQALTLKVCVTASLKRGVLGSHEAEYADQASNLSTPFEQVGMADYFAVFKDEPDTISVQF
jgi:tRNA 2-thiouridine synthesizing protein D